VQIFAFTWYLLYGGGKLVCPLNVIKRHSRVKQYEMQTPRVWQAQSIFATVKFCNNWRMYLPGQNTCRVSQVYLDITRTWFVIKIFTWWICHRTQTARAQFHVHAEKRHNDNDNANARMITRRILRRVFVPGICIVYTYSTSSGEMPDRVLKRKHYVL